MGATFLLIFKVYLINSFFSLLTTSQLSLIFPRSTPGLGYLLLSPHLYTTTGLQPSLLPLLWYQFITPQLHQWCQHPAHYVCGYLVAHLCPTLCDPMDCSPPGSSVHGDSPGKNTGVGCHALFLGIFPIQGSNPGLPHCRQILYHLSHRGRGVLLPLLKNPPWVVLPYSYILVFLHLCGTNLLEGIDYTCYHQVLSFHSLLKPLQSCLHLHHVWVFSKPRVISVLLNLVVSSASSSYLASLQLFVQLTNFFLAIFPTLDFPYTTLFWISFFLPGYCFSVSSALLFPSNFLMLKCPRVQSSDLSTYSLSFGDLIWSHGFIFLYLSIHLSSVASTLPEQIRLLCWE